MFQATGAAELDYALYIYTSYNPAVCVRVHVHVYLEDARSRICGWLCLERLHTQCVTVQDDHILGCDADDKTSWTGRYIRLAPAVVLCSRYGMHEVWRRRARANSMVSEKGNRGEHKGVRGMLGGCRWVYIPRSGMYMQMRNVRSKASDRTQLFVV